MNGRFARRVSLFSVAGLLLLPACTQNSPLAPPSSTFPAAAPIATTSKAPGGGATATPTAATDEQLAIKAVERFYDEFNKAIQTRSTTTFRLTYRSVCDICEAAADKIDAAANAGRYFGGGHFSVDSLRVVARPTNTRLLTIEGLVTNQATIVRDASGRVVDQDQGASGAKQFIVFRADTGWMINGVSNA